MAAKDGPKHGGEQKDLPERKPTMLDVNMPEEDQQKAVEFANAAMNIKELVNERDVAQYITKEMQKCMEGGRWHCVYGKSFGSFVTYESGKFIHFVLGQHHIMIWKHG
eukprot:TRINITY_DN37745_c0_g1_i1.p1 TRINITY_DN37745_c0_g1~~TRINITY_DN37745_c0_g1_i1.p1  ORF type:complete len:108 (+),score=16.80 TRINITY_DN37745_c0_g1_i1:55-378(+)